MNLAHPIVSKNKDGALKVIVAGRISTDKQDEKSIEAQQYDAQKWLGQFHKGPTQVEPVGEQASGWLVDRPSMVRAQGLIATRSWDLVLASELRAIYRNPASHWDFVYHCVDHDTRFICIADNIDTADPSWEMMMHVASLRHGLAVPETRRRVKSKATFSFEHGGMVLKVKFGFRKLSKEEAASGKYGTPGLRIAKCAEWTPIIEEMARRVIVCQHSPDAVAEWLQEEQIPTGPYVKSGRWSGRLVEELLRDPILSGRRRFRSVTLRPIYKTGIPRRERNPTPDIKEWQELAHLTIPVHEEVLAAFEARKPKRDFKSGKDSPAWNRPRSKTIWPGQHARCSACREGRMLRCGQYLKCKNALSHGSKLCWNHVQVSIEIVQNKVMDWILGVLDSQPDFRKTMADAAWREIHRVRQRGHQGNDRLIEDMKRRAKNLTKAIAAGGKLESLVTELQSVEKSLAEAVQRRKILSNQEQQIESFKSPEDVESHLDDAISVLIRQSFEFGDVIRRLIPKFIIQPVQALDTPLIRPRAKLTLDLGAWCHGSQPVPPPVSVELDLFEPPAHIKHLAACTAAKQADPKASLKTIARRVGINYMTVKRAHDYARRMESEGLTEPYREVHERPEKASRWKRRPRSEQPPK